MPQHIVVTAYNPAWPGEFAREAAALRGALGENCLDIHHIGSTAVEGQAAKPIIDIMPVVRSLTEADRATPALERLGYEYLGEFGIPGRRYLRKGGDERTHQVHIFACGDAANINRHLAVRDYLRAHPAVREAYAVLKRRLAEQFPYDIDGYCDGKQSFVQELERLALAAREGDRINTPMLVTERLVLRRFTPDDLPAIYQIYSDPETNRFLPWFALTSYAEAERFYERHCAAVYRQARGYCYAVCLKSDNVPIGDVHVGTDEGFDFGYALRQPFWHRGIATEAAHAVLERLRLDGIPYVTATHDVNNPRSGAVMQRLGMRYQYSYREQWQPKDIPVIFRMYQLNFDGSARVFRKYWDAAAVRFVEALDGTGAGSPAGSFPGGARSAVLPGPRGKL